MEKHPDPWSEVASLIEKDKKRALDDFHGHEFFPGALPPRRPALLSAPRAMLRPAIMAAAASVLLAAGLVSFWLLRGNWQKAPAAPATADLLADSVLYDNNRPGKIAAEPRADSPFTTALSAWTTAAESRSDNAPVAEPAGPSAPVEHGDPAAVQRKIEKLIRENTLERILTQFCQICREV
jgi:hypothetical protein